MISVIIPAYNLENCIERAVLSVVNQTHKDIEIIVVDDGSKDQTAEIVKRLVKQYPDKLRLIQISNSGVTNARLTGAKLAQGEWIGFVDGDDEIEPEMYELLVGNAIKYKADISHCGYQMVFEDGRVNCFHGTGNFILQDRTQGIKDLLDGSLVEPGLCNKLFSKTLIENIYQQHNIPVDIKINEDLLMNYYLFRASKLSVFEDKCLYHYIVRKTSASRQKLNVNKIYDPILVKKIIVDNAENEIEIDARKAYIKTCINTYNTLILENAKEYQKDIKNVRMFILQNKEWVYLLGNKQKLLGILIGCCPNVYKQIYKIYEKYFQKKMYK